MWTKGPRSVQANSGPSRSASFTWNRDFDELWIALQQTPKNGGTPIADYRTAPAGEDSGHPPAVRREAAVPDRVYPAMDPVERPSAQTRRDRMPSQPRRNELGERDDAVLSLGNAGDPKVGCGVFFPHVGE
jgi:hypothetical protein